MKKLFIAAILICTGTILRLAAQNEADALRYSQVYYSGTARASAMGGSFGALGGDFSSLSINPAGIGIYQKSELSITPSVYFTMMKSNFNDYATKERKYNFNLGNFGAVFVMKPKKESSCKAIQFGIGFNRLNNYNYSTYIEGGNPKSSYVDYLRDIAQQTNPENLRPFDTRLAFDTYLIDTLVSPNYISNVPNGGLLVQKSMDISGSNNELVITLGGNWNDRLYVGGTFGFPYLRYYESSTYEETDKADTIPNFKHLAYNYNLETHGSGFNFKLGFIYRIADWMRVGAAFSTPTYYTMKDKWSTDIQADFDTISYKASSPEGHFDYKLNTPFKANASIAFVIGKVALITGEYEMVDYKGARFKAVDNSSFSKENRAIENTLAFQSNIRAGFEIKINQFALRAGYTYSSNPYANKSYGSDRQAISGGMGVKFDRYFLDASYSYIMSKEQYYLYPSVAYPVDNKLTAQNAMVTFGVKF